MAPSTSHRARSRHHLADVSDLSFQIPAGVDTGELLMADDEDLFFQGVDDSSSAARFGDHLALSGLVPHATGSPQPPACSPPLSAPLPPSRRAQRGQQAPPEAACAPAPLVRDKKPNDDMFERMKRDKYLQKGVDLSAHSTRSRRIVEAALPASPGDGRREGDAAAMARGGVTTAPLMSLEHIIANAVRSRWDDVTHRPSPVPEIARATSALMNNVNDQNATIPGSQVGDRADAAPLSPGENVADISVGASGGGVAERLVLYSQRLMNSISLFSSREAVRPTSAEPSTQAPTAPHKPPPPPPSANQNPLSLSELSPRKATFGNPTDWKSGGVSPLRPSKKRALKQQRADHEPDPKRSRTAAAPAHMRGGGASTSSNSRAADARRRGDRARGVGKGKGRRERALQSAAGAGTAREAQNVPSLGAEQAEKAPKQKRVLQSSSVTNMVPGVRSASRAAAHHHAVAMKMVSTGHTRGERKDVSSCTTTATEIEMPGDEDRHRDLERSDRAWHAREQEEQEKTYITSKMLAHGKLSAVLPLPKPTVPLEFRFQSDVRAETRRHDFEEKMKTWEKRAAVHAPLPVPDFKALHAAHEASVAARRKQVVPVVPAPLALSTEARVREREQFDEARRAREREIERQLEERARQREEEEERERREMRKKAVPKANAVPDWYAEAPKKGMNSKTASMSSSVA